MEKHAYNPTYFDGRDLISRKGLQAVAFKTFILSDGLILGLFQGNRGDQEHLDFVIKFLEPGPKKETRTPAHIHWVVDLLLKAETHRGTVTDFVNFYRNFYDAVGAFKSVDERNSYRPVTPAQVRRLFGELNNHGTYSLEYLSYLLELFAICEKASPRPVKMFPELLATLQRYFDGDRDFVQVLGAAIPKNR